MSWSFLTIYFPGYVCFVLYLAKISGERLQDHWSSGFNPTPFLENGLFSLAFLTENAADIYKLLFFLQTDISFICFVYNSGHLHA